MLISSLHFSGSYAVKFKLNLSWDVTLVLLSFDVLFHRFLVKLVPRSYWFRRLSVFLFSIIPEFPIGFHSVSGFAIEKISEMQVHIRKLFLFCTDV